MQIQLPVIDSCSYFHKEIKYSTFDNFVSEKERLCGNRSYALSHKQVTKNINIMCGSFSPFLPPSLTHTHFTSSLLWVEHKATQQQFPDIMVFYFLFFLIRAGAAEIFFAQPWQLSTMWSPSPTFWGLI